MGIILPLNFKQFLDLDMILFSYVLSKIISIIVVKKTINPRDKNVFFWWVIVGNKLEFIGFEGLSSSRSKELVQFWITIGDQKAMSRSNMYIANG